MQDLIIHLKLEMQIQAKKEKIFWLQYKKDRLNRHKAEF